MDKKEIVNVLNEISILYELKNESFFKIRAYQMAARALETSDIDINKNTSLDGLLGIKGIGKSIADQILELAESGSLGLFNSLRASIPPGLIEMLKIPKLGPKKIKYLYDTLSITSISELEAACAQNRLAALLNFGKKTQENILHGIEIIKKFQDKFLYASIIDEAEKILAGLRDFKYIDNCSIAGSLRRKKEVIKDIDIVASTSNPGAVMDFFTGRNEADEIIAKGETKSSIRLKSGINVDIRLVENFQYPYALHHFTGSKEHNTAMRSLAKKYDIKMNEYGLFKGSKIIKCKSEKDIFAVFGMDYIEPEMRENTGEIQAAAVHALPEIISVKDIKGLFHFHTNNSDGSMDLRQAATELMKMGFTYCGIADHSKAAAYAGGIPDEKIPEYIDKIGRMSQEFEGFKIFKGIESDILADGSLDYCDELLEMFDFVIIAIHSNFNMNQNQMTERIIKAMQNRHTTMLAHPTGRLLLTREPYNVNIIDIIDSAAKYNVDLEINANPYRLDLDWQSCKYAKEKNVKMFINPDAHSTEGFHDYIYGVDVARKGWLEKKDIVNTWPSQQISEYLIEKKNKKSKKSLNI